MSEPRRPGSGSGSGAGRGQDRGRQPVAATFDDQAARYDRRAGLPPHVCDAVARAVLSAATASGAERLNGVLVELGAGTGEIGCDLARACGPGRYLGLDAAPGMLAEFQAKAAPGAPWLVIADGAGRWPLGDARAAAVFASRVVHLLPPDRVATEARRVTRPGGYLLLGRVERDRDSIAERLNQQRRQLLAATGTTARDSARGTRRLIAACEHAGATLVGRQDVITWEATTTANEVIAHWATQTRIGAAPMIAPERDALLDHLRQWALAELGDLDAPVTAPQTYVLDGVRFPAATRAGRV